MNSIRKAAAIAILASLPFAAGAFDCKAIDATTQEAFNKSRNEGRKEVARKDTEGGGFQQPRQSRDATCTSEMQALMSMGGFSTGYAYMDKALQIAAQKAITKSCDKLEKQAEASRNRLGKAIDSATPDILK